MDTNTIQVAVQSIANDEKKNLTPFRLESRQQLPPIRGNP